MPANMWRMPASKVKKVGRMSFVQDNGVMRSAPPASNGFYLFSEVGAGIKPMVLVGTVDEITAFLIERKSSGIENQIVDAPDIYIKITPARKGTRFIGLFPIHDFIGQLVDKLAGFAPGSQLTDIVGAIKDGHDAVTSPPTYKKAFSTSKDNSKPLPANTFAVFFSYFEDPGFTKVGTKRVGFDALYGYVDKELSKQLGI